MGLATSVRHGGKTADIITLPVVVMLPVGGRVQPARLNPGETLDLHKVNIPFYIAAMQHTDTKRMLANGVINAVQVEVSEAVELALRAEQAKLSPAQKAETFVADGSYQAVAIEPGLYVAVGNGGLEPPKEIPPVTEVVSAGAQAVEAPVEELTAGKEVAAVTEEPVVPVEEIPSWKDGKTLDEMKKYIKASTDREFLQSILDDAEESLGLKKLAKETLAKLK